MIAPSEKHLEDWIVGRSGCILPYEGNKYKVIARQVRLSSGVADLIVFDGNSLWLYELKKGTVDENALAQILRYRADLMRIWRKATKPALNTIEESYALYPFCVHAMLLGYNSHKDILVAAAGAYVSVYLYDYDGETYHCQYADTQNMPEYVAEQFAYGVIGESMRESLSSHLTEQARYAL